MAGSLDLAGTACLLLLAGLAKLDGKVVTSRRVARLNRVADLNTLKGIARLLITSRPPDWLRAVVVNGRLIREYVPRADLAIIDWRGDDLESILGAAHEDLYGAADDRLLKLLGDAGELAVMSAMQAKGLAPRHVALVSDHYGYDVESGLAHQLRGVEVKAAVSSTAGRILVSRNEHDVAGRLAHRWSLVQVVFSTRVLLVGRAVASDVEQIRELASSDLCSLAPEEGPSFRWMQSAEFRPGELWKSSDLKVAPDFAAELRPEE